jgi:hypothetical protein
MRPMRLGHRDRSHLDQLDANPAARDLIRRLTARKARADNGYLSVRHRYLG